MRLPRARTALLAAAVGLALVTSACASGTGVTTGGSVAPTGDEQAGAAPSPTGRTGGPADGEATPKPATVPEILDFEAPLVGGGTLDGAELAGAPVAVWFWAPW